MSWTVKLTFIIMIRVTEFFTLRIMTFVVDCMDVCETETDRQTETETDRYRHRDTERHRLTDRHMGLFSSTELPSAVE